MPRSSRLVLLVLVAFSGCRGLHGCGTSEPPASAVASAASAPDASTPGVTPPPPEAAYAKTWLVILHSSPTPGEGAQALEALKKTGLPAEPRRLSSNAFRNLRPCLEVVVARAFPDKAGAEGFQKQLVAAGVDAYVKNAGALDPERENKEAACRAVATRASAPGRAVPRFVEVQAGRTFMLLGKAADESGLQPVDDSRSLWMGPASVDPSGFFAQGDAVDLYGASGLVQPGCKVTGFARINRGVPHFGYLQQQPPPTEPGCGQAWAFAELDCGMTPNDVVFALPAGTKAPEFYTPGDAPSEELRAEQDAALRKTARFVELSAEGHIEAEQVQEPLKEEVKASTFSQGERQVVLTKLHVYTGEGEGRCGRDYSAQVSRAVVRGPGVEARALSVKELDADEVVGVLDLEGDGRVELLLDQSWTGRHLRLVREDGTEVAGSEVEFCDSGC